MQNRIAILIPEATYHVFNRANGKERLFFSEENYHYFLKKYASLISPVADTFCYCLMPNHFHFIIRVKTAAELQCSNLSGFQTLTGLSEEKLSTLLSRQFSHLFNGYAQAINKQETRKGSLFMRPFKRKRITDDKYLKNLVHYIHFNPKEAGLVAKLEDWKFSSFNAISDPTGLKNLSGLAIKKEEVIEWFEDLENFMDFHKVQSRSIDSEYL